MLKRDAIKESGRSRLRPHGLRDRSGAARRVTTSPCAKWSRSFSTRASPASRSRSASFGSGKAAPLQRSAANQRARLKGTTNLEDLADCDIVIEAIIENVGAEERDLRRARQRS